MRQIVLDTETTGLQTEEGHRIIEIGCIELIDRKFTQKKFHYYLNPERIIDEGAFAVHGITNEFLKDKPLFADIAPALIDFINGAELIIHNAPFDVGFLNHELRLANQAWQNLTEYCRIVDTLVLARQLHIGQRNNLDALCKRYNIDNSKRDMHGALLDANLLAQVYLLMTGGQASLFEELNTTKPLNNEKKVSKPSYSKRGNLALITLDPEDLIQHQEKLHSLQEKGKCVWVEN